MILPDSMAARVLGELHTTPAAQTAIAHRVRLIGWRVVALLRLLAANGWAEQVGETHSYRITEAGIALREKLRREVA